MADGPACLQRLCLEPSTTLEELFLASSPTRLGAHGTEGTEGGGLTCPGSSGRRAVWRSGCSCHGRTTQ